MVSEGDWFDQSKHILHDSLVVMTKNLVLHMSQWELRKLTQSEENDRPVFPLIMSPVISFYCCRKLKTEET